MPDNIDDETGTTNPDLEKALDKSGAGKIAVAPISVPMYRVDFIETKIPVSKELGNMWLGRRDVGLAARKPHEESWDEAISYYLNDQS